MITKTLNETCGSLWVVKAARILFEDEVVHIGLHVYEDQDAVDAGQVCHKEAISVPSDGFDGTVAWCENALKTDPDSKLKD